ncbi:MAG TPA: diguanylate cyclase, partial [Geothrix sp.]
GDEFGLLLYGCGISKAQEIAEGICRGAADYRFEWEGRSLSIGASIGVIPLLDRDSLTSLFEAADGACYHAKETGRGRVCVDHRLSSSDEVQARNSR